MNLVSELDLPAFDYTAPDFSADRYHQQLWRPVMRGFLENLWARVAAHRSCDFVAAVARFYSALTIATVLGAPHQDAGRLHTWSTWVQRQFDIRALQTSRDDIERAVTEAQEYVTGLLEARRAAPGDDLISENGESFDITAARDTRLLTFGAGTHYCVGANLARAELEEALAFLAPRTPGLALDGPPQLGGVEGLYGIDKLPIIWSGSSEMSPNHGLAPDVS